MSIKVNIYGAEKESDEYQSAMKLKNIILRDVPHEVEGEIVLFASATLFGQIVKDVDLMMLGILKNYKIENPFDITNQDKFKKKIEIKSFCTTIEIKSHDISGIYVNGTDFYVKYGKKSHCVTVQSNKQKIAAMNFFKATISFSPYITNLIWFNQADSEDIETLLENNGKKMPSNVFGAEFSFESMMQLLIYQKPPYEKIIT